MTQHQLLLRLLVYKAQPTETTNVNNRAGTDDRPEVA
jgi:hypothetical protein